MIFLKIFLIVLVVAEVLAIGLLAWALWWVIRMRARIKRAAHIIRTQGPVWRRAIETGTLTWQHAQGFAELAVNFLPPWLRWGWRIAGWANTARIKTGQLK